MDNLMLDILIAINRLERDVRKLREVVCVLAGIERTK